MGTGRVGYVPRRLEPIKWGNSRRVDESLGGLVKPFTVFKSIK